MAAQRKDEEEHDSVEFGLSKTVLFADSEGILQTKNQSFVYKDTLILTNNSKKSVTFGVPIPPIPSDQNWGLVVTPMKGEVKKGKSVEIEYSLRVYKKVDVQQKLSVVIYPKPKFSISGDSKTSDKPFTLSLSFAMVGERSPPVDDSKVLRRIGSGPDKVINVEQPKSLTNSEPRRASVPDPHARSEDHDNPYMLSPKMEIRPSENLAAIGWMETISREETEFRLCDEPSGTFLFRWSDRTKSYVLSYKMSGSKIHHINQIKRNKTQAHPNGIAVKEEDSSIRKYDSMLAFIMELKSHGILTNPLHKDGAYSFSPPKKHTD